MSKVLMFHSKSCQPCQSTILALKKVAREKGLGVRVVDVDSKRGGELADREHIRFTPTIIVEKGHNRRRIIGEVGEEKLNSLL